MPRFSENDFEAEMDMGTLMQAAELDKNPGRKARAVARAKQKIAELESFIGESNPEAETMAKGFRKVG